MALPLLVDIDISGPAAVGLSELDLSRLGNVYLTVTPANVDDTITYIFANFALYSFSVNVTAINDTTLVSALLDAGAVRVFVSRAQLTALAAVDSARIVLAVQSTDNIAEATAGVSTGIYIHKATDTTVVNEWLQSRKSEAPVFVSFDRSLTAATVVAVAKLGATPVIPRAELTTDPAANPTLLSAAEIFTAAVTSDRADGLIATLVVDEQGVALGLVYSSAESVKESLRTGTGVYQSRKRGLWYKGASSGAVQELVKIDADCDQDCLRFFVRQKGAGELYTYWELTSAN